MREKLARVAEGVAALGGAEDALRILSDTKIAEADSPLYEFSCTTSGEPPDAVPF